MNMHEKVLLEGNLKDYTLPQILIFCSRSQKTGELIFEREYSRKCIYFTSGKAIFASSSQSSDRLGDILLHAGMISEEQYAKSANIYSHTGKRKGMILVEEGYLKPEDLISVIRGQVKEIILSLFEWEDGTFRFKESPQSDEVITIDLSLKELIREGIQRREENKRSEERLLKEDVNRLYEKIGSLSHYEILGLNMDSTFSEIKEAYYEKVQIYHPDKHRSLSDPVLDEKLSAVLSLLNESYNILKDEKKRAKYDKSIFTSPKKDKPRMTLAHESFLRGVSNLKEGNYWNAADSFRWATRTTPNEAKYWSYLSLALSKMPRRAKDAEDALLKAIELEPQNANHYVQLGIIYMEANMKLRAIRQFETALSWNPYNDRALTELGKLKDKKKKDK